MATSIFLAKLVGPIFLLVGLGVLANPSFYRAVAQDVQQGRGLLYLIAVVRFVAGLTIVLVHNIWVADWRVVLTLIGWIGVIRGALLLVAPEFALSYARRLLEREALLSVTGSIAILLGCLLCFFGYFG